MKFRYQSFLIHDCPPYRIFQILFAKQENTLTEYSNPAYLKMGKKESMSADIPSESII
jgi:hypothetical protein